MAIRDYTALPAGKTTLDEEIRICPYCGRHGLFETVGNKDFYTHSQGIAFDAQGTPTMDWTWHFGDHTP